MKEIGSFEMRHFRRHFTQNPDPPLWNQHSSFTSQWGVIHFLISICSQKDSKLLLCTSLRDSPQSAQKKLASYSCLPASVCLGLPWRCHSQMYKSVTADVCFWELLTSTSMTSPLCPSVLLNFLCFISSVHWPELQLFLESLFFSPKLKLSLSFIEGYCVLTWDLTSGNS